MVFTDYHVEVDGGNVFEVGVGTRDGRRGIGDKLEVRQREGPLENSQESSTL